MPRKFPDRDDDCLPVMVPRSDKRLVPLTPERVERLRQHLREALLDLGKARQLDRFAAPVSLEPAGFAATVARAACSLCKGWCCRNGGDEAFLDGRTLARLRLTNPKITEQAIELIYLARVPDAASLHLSCHRADRDGRIFYLYHNQLSTGRMAERQSYISKSFCTIGGNSGSISSPPRRACYASGATDRQLRS